MKIMTAVGTPMVPAVGSTFIVHDKFYDVSQVLWHVENRSQLFAKRVLVARVMLDLND